MTRIYKVIVHDTRGVNVSRLVRAATASQAVRFVATPMIEAVIPDQEELHALGIKGVEIEDATEVK